MKIFELLPPTVTDLLPTALNQEIPVKIDQVADQVIDAGKFVGYAGVGLAIKTKSTLDELAALGEQALGESANASQEDTSAVDNAPVVKALPEDSPQESENKALEALFNAAAENVKGLANKPDNATLVELYALYKQSTVGDVSGKRPGMTKVAERYKFDAWTRRKGMDSDQAKQAYIDKVEALLAVK